MSFLQKIISTNQVVKIIWHNIELMVNSWQAKLQVNYQSLQEPIENSLK